MKNKFYNILLAVSVMLLSLVSCGKEYADYTAPDTLHDTSWIIGFDPLSTGEERFLVNRGEAISFVDLSQGTQKHQWIIENGNYFLKEPFRGDSLQTFIKNNDTITNNVKAHVLFSKAGTANVRLRNTYDQPVSYTTSNGTFTTPKEGSVWVLDTIFTFKVFDYIQPNFKISKNGTEVITITADEVPTLDNKDDWPTIELEAGALLTYEDLTTIGEPNTIRWNVPNGSPIFSGANPANISFFRLGTFDAGTITVSRNDIGGNLPNASVERIIPLKVKVIPSSQPLVITGNAREGSDEVLTLQVNGELNPFTGQESFFTVNVQNDNGFDNDISVSSAKLSSSNATMIELRLNEAIYNTDKITISYAGGSITSLDERNLEDTTAPVNVITYFDPNILPSNGWAGFENSSGDIRGALAQDYWVGNNNKVNGSDTDGFYERSTTRVFEGNASMHFKQDAPITNLNLFGFAIAKPNPVPAGTYKVSYQLYLEPGNQLKVLWTEINKPNWARYTWNIEDLPRGSWQKIEEIIEFPNGIPDADTTWTFRFHPGPNGGITGTQEFYIDDFSLVKLEIRP